MERYRLRSVRGWLVSAERMEFSEYPDLAAIFEDDASLGRAVRLWRFVPGEAIECVRLEEIGR